MSIRSHRVVKVLYAEGGLSFQRGTKLGDFLANHSDANDQTNMDGRGIIEFPFRVLKEALKLKNKLKFDADEVESLKKEVEALKNRDDDYIWYDMF